MDARLHAERVDARSRAQRRHDGRLEDLPDGAFVLCDDEPWLVLGDELRHWTAAGYDATAPRRDGPAVLLTPPSLAAVLRAGWDPAVPLLHPSALSPG
jgi:hypothetical protein